MAARADDGPEDTERYRGRISARDVYDRLAGTEAVVKRLEKVVSDNQSRTVQLERTLETLSQEFTLRREHDAHIGDTRDHTVTSHSVRIKKLEQQMPEKHMRSHQELDKQVAKMPTWANIALAVTTLVVIMSLLLEVVRLNL